MPRARTIKQGLALAFGRYRYAGMNGDNVEALRRRNEAMRENEAQGLHT